MKNNQLSLFLISFFSTITYAQEVNQIGPHKGQIQKAGEIYTEMLLEKDKSYSVYLLDSKLQKMLIKDTAINLTYKNSTEAINFNCRSVGDHYRCMPGRPINKSQGQMILEVLTANNKDVQAVYLPPLL